MTDDLEIKSNPPVDRLDPAPDHWNWTRLSHIVHFGHGADPNQVEVDSPGYPVYGSGGQFKWASEWLYDGPSVLFGRKGTVDRPIFVDGKFWTVDRLIAFERVSAACTRQLRISRPGIQYATTRRL